MGLRLLAVACGGVLVFLAGYPARWPWLELFAFLPLLDAARSARSFREAGSYGLTWALGRALPLAVMLKGFALPVEAAAAVLAYVLALDALFAWSVFWMRSARTLPFALGVAASFTAIEVVDSVLPMWGTARSLATAWAAFPNACGLIRSWGTPAIAFVVVLVQALVVGGVRRRERHPLVVALAALTLVALLSVARPPPARRALTVAAVGWGLDANRSGAEQLVSSAAKSGAKLVAFPEVTFKLTRGERAAFEAHWSRVAREHRVWLVLPFSEPGGCANCLLVLDAAGNARGTYAKTHLVPLAERQQPGTGELLLFEVEGVRVGVMICQDDNFRDLARAYARAGAELLVVPSFEGPASVAPYHFENSRLRSIENSVALLRATAQGTSALFGPGGFSLATLNPEHEASGILIASVPVASTRAPSLR